VKFDKGLQRYSNWKNSNVATLGLALYLRMGGTVVEMEESESDEVSSYFSDWDIDGYYDSDSDDEPDLWQLWLHW